MKASPMSSNPENTPPALPALPVLRSNYCTQEMTNEAISFLQRRQPDLIATLASQQRRGRGGNSMYYRSLNDVENYLTYEASKEIQITQTALGMVDLLFELSRRIAAACDLQEVQLVGKSLAEGPDSPLVPLAGRSDLPESLGVTPDLADHIVRLVYEQSPRLFYELGEQYIRQLRTNALTRKLDTALTALEPHGAPKTKTPRIRLTQEINWRLHKMCGCPQVTS